MRHIINIRLNCMKRLLRLRVEHLMNIFYLKMDTVVQFWLFVSAIVWACFIQYHCSEHCRIKKQTADCSSQDRKSVPKDLPANINRLILANNSISYLPDASFNRYKNLNILDLSTNNITTLEPKTFQGLAALRILFLANNHLDKNASFPPGVFSRLTLLKKLDISGNFGFSTDPLVYPYMGDLENLQSLTIDLVSIPIFDGCGFEQMKNLKNLEFSKCRLNHMCNFSFAAIKAPIKKLRISDCLIVKSVEANFLSPLKKLSKLHLTNSCLRLDQAFKMLYPFEHRTMDEIYFEDLNHGLCRGPFVKPYAVIVTPTMVQHFQKICIKKLVLKKNGIVDFEETSLLSHSYARCFESVRILENKFCPSNGFKSVELFILLRSLTNLTNFEFSEKEKTVNVLEVTEQSDGKNDEKLDLQVPPKLKSFTLSSTNAGFFPHTMKIFLQNISSLRYLDLSYYWIFKFPEVNVDSENHIQHLDISGIPSVLYSQQTKIPLFKNATTVLMVHSLLGRTIEKRNRIFALFPAVVKLNISHNILWHIPTGSFTLNSNLQELCMSNNLFTEIPHSITKLPKLRRLNVQHNIIHTINSTLRTFFERQRIKMKRFQLDLTGNTFSCNCDTTDFVAWLFNTKIQFDARDDLKCKLSNGTLLKISKVYEHFHALFNDCKAEMWLRVGVAMLTSFVVCTIPIAIIVNFRWRIAFWIFNIFKHAIEKEMRKSFKFDVYLSCGDDNWPWVKEILIPKIESCWKLKMCIGERDFPAWEVKVDIISKSIHESRSILFILSNCYKDRDCALFEIQRAKYERFCRKMQRIIVIDRGMDYDNFPVELGTIIDDILIVNWDDDECESNWDKLKTLLLSGSL